MPENTQASKIIKKYNNMVFVFLPFVLDTKSESHAVRLKGWKKKKQNVRYLLKYISDKMDGESGEGLLEHYVLEEASKTFPFLDKEITYKVTVGGGSYRENTRRDVEFIIKDIRLFLFSDRMGIMAFELSFKESDPITIARAEFELKKVSKDKIIGPDGRTYSLLSMAKEICKESLKDGEIRFFDFSNPGEERANIFTYVEVPEENTNYKEELFRLKNCYGLGFPYDEEIEDEKGNGIFRIAPDLYWGISDEAIACRIIITEENYQFRQYIFKRNIKKNYLPMYVMLLHQKYALYHFYTELGIDSNNTEGRLEHFKEALNRFETNYMFSFVTEVPQYQNVYDRVYKEFRIREMFEELQNPIQKLAEEKATKREQLENRVLFIIAFLGISSFLIDYFDAVDYIAQIFSGSSLSIQKAFDLLGILVVMIVIIIYVKFWKRDHRNK